MLRQARVVIRNYPYHVVQRGNYKLNVFDEDENKKYYMMCFMHYRKEFNVKLYAWCLMDNHGHFILEPTTEHGLGKIFKQL